MFKTLTTPKLTPFAWRRHPLHLGDHLGSPLRLMVCTAYPTELEFRSFALKDKAAAGAAALQSTAEGGCATCSRRLEHVTRRVLVYLTRFLLIAEDRHAVWDGQGGDPGIFCRSRVIGRLSCGLRRSR